MPFDSSLAVKTDEVLRHLVEARALIADKSKWLQGAYCEGDRFCIYGAIHHVGDYGDIGEAERGPVAKHLEKFAKTRWLNEWNDAHTHADVLSLFDRAIAARRGELS